MYAKEAQVEIDRLKLRIKLLERRVMKLEYYEEEYDCVMMCLDDRDIPKTVGPNVYSLWGRIEQTLKNKEEVK